MFFFYNRQGERIRTGDPTTMASPVASHHSSQAAGPQRPPPAAERDDRDGRQGDRAPMLHAAGVGGQQDSGTACGRLCGLSL